MSLKFTVMEGAGISAGIALGGMVSLVPKIGLAGEVTSIVLPPAPTVPAAAYGAKIVTIRNEPGSPLLRMSIVFAASMKAASRASE